VSLTYAPNIQTDEVTRTPDAADAHAEAPAGAGSVPDCGQTEVPPSSAEAVHQEATEGRCWCGRPFGPGGVLAVMRDGARWVRRLRTALGVDRLPYVLVAERHRDGHLHAHVLLDRFVDRATLRRTWHHGWVDARKFRGKGGREAARKAGAYAAKYVGKTFELEDQGVTVGRHRYEVGEGFQPSVVKRTGFRSLSAALDWVTVDHGQVVAFAVHSDTLEDYEGPPFVWVALDSG
jgi:hypothetical protein